MTKNMIKCSAIGKKKLYRPFLLLLFLAFSAVNAEAKEYWNLIKPVPDAVKASAMVLDAVALGYQAFREGETGNMDQRRASLLSAGTQILEAADLMFVVAEALDKQGAGMVTAEYQNTHPLVMDSMKVWLDSRGQIMPKTVLELYATGASSTKELGEKFIGWAERTDDDVFSEFVRETAFLLQAGWAGSRVFEASGF